VYSWDWFRPDEWLPIDGDCAPPMPDDIDTPAEEPPYPLHASVDHPLVDWLGLQLHLEADLHRVPTDDDIDEHGWQRGVEWLDAEWEYANTLSTALILAGRRHNTPELGGDTRFPV